MIRIDRDRLDEQGLPIQPDAAWFKAAKDAEDLALLEREQHQVDRGVYAHASVRAALEKLFHDKCAYCETRITGGSEWDVEHFRPKGSVAERDDHPGYYWLAYSWRNLYPSCTFCNQRRKDRPRWGDPGWGAAQGKVDHFPLEDEGARALAPGPIVAERPLLLDPCSDDPELYLSVTVLGQPVSIDNNPRGTASIKFFHLKRKRLRDLRKRTIEEAVFIAKCVKKYRAAGPVEAWQDFKELLERTSSDSSEYAATVRAVRRDPDAFGV